MNTKMQQTYIQDKIFNEQELLDKSLQKGEYENCVFNNGNFGGKDFSGFRFIDCVFNNCNFSLAKLEMVILRDLKFNACKMIGLRFDTCNPFGPSFLFEKCQLDLSSFYGMKIKNTVFKNSQMQETDFTECDLTNAVFDNCNLTQSIFNHTILEKADFRTSYNYSIDPCSNRLKKAKFSWPGITGLLDKYDIEIDHKN